MNKNQLVHIDLEVNEGNINQMAVYLQQTLSPDAAVRKPAEDFLKSVEGNQNYPVLLLSLLSKEDGDMNIKVAGAITFKNYVKRNWKVDEDAPDKIHQTDRDTVKGLIVDLMLKSPLPVQKQLSAAIAIIGQDLVIGQDLGNDMVVKFQSGDFHIINGVLQTAHSIFEKYSVQFKSQKLEEEIKFVLDNFAGPFTDLFVATIGLAELNATNEDALKVIFGSLVLICKIFYHLNYQNLPEFFENNMQKWMPRFHTLLTLENSLLDTDDDEPGVLEELRSQICDNIGLYAHKYEDKFKPFIERFLMAVGNILLNTGLNNKYDLLVSNAIQFLASVADRPQNKNLFEDENVLSNICERVIVPNMEMRKCDVELFEDNAEEYIRRDLEGSDVDTRRRAACDLVKGLSRHFKAKITEILKMYVKTMLDKYAQNPVANWKSKDAAMYLVTSLATKAKTAKHGISETNELVLVDLTKFAKYHVIPEIANATNTNHFLMADCLKYIMTFCSQFPPELAKSISPSLGHLLTNPHRVVHTYTKACIEKLRAIAEDLLIQHDDLFLLEEQPTRLTFNNGVTIEKCKEEILAHLRLARDQNLILTLNGEVLTDHKTLAEHRIKDDDVIGVKILDVAQESTSSSPDNHQELIDIIKNLLEKIGDFLKEMEEGGTFENIRNAM